METLSKVKASENKILKPAGRDFIIKLLLEHGTKRVLLFICIVVSFCLLAIIASFINGTFINRNLKTDALHDLGYYIQSFLLLPFFVFFLPYYFNDMQKAIHSLKETKILNMSDSFYNDAIDYSNRLFSHWGVTLFPYLFSGIAIILSFISYFFAGQNHWNSSESFESTSITTLFAIGQTLLFFYFISAILIRIILTYFVLKKILNENVNIQPLHPDNCGGLSPLGDFSLKISSAGVGVGIPVMILLIFDVYIQGWPLFSTVHILDILIYIVSLTIVFFLPLLGARSSMLMAKNKELKFISDHFQEERKQIVLNIDSEQQNQDLGISRLEGLMKLYDMARAMPVYPFNSRNVIRFFGSVLWPILLLLVQFIMQKILH
jgi:hypothetical protein